MIGFAIGNGLSRLGFDLERLKGKGVTVGCNWLYKDFDADYIVFLDHHMITHMANLEDKNFKPLTRWRDDETKEMWLSCEGEKVRPLVQINQGRNNNSGIMATCFLSEVLQLDEVYLIGMDFFLDVYNEDKTEIVQNDVYLGKFRRSEGYHRVWNNIATNNPQTKFYRVGPIADADRDFYTNYLSGYKLIESFEDMPI